MIDIDQDDLTISINRGDTAIINIVIPLDNGDNYVFQPGDEISLRIYEKNGYDKLCIIKKTKTVTTETETAQIQLSEGDTLILVPEPQNQKVIFWYDISLNEDKTIIGYDEDGVKKFIVNPAKGGNEN